MPIKFGSGERIKSSIDTYVVEGVISQGGFAHAAKARSERLGKYVFLKRYFSPTPALPWYQPFVEHQQELKNRITSNDALRQYCYGFIDFFEGTDGRALKTFHQVFDFVENAQSLAQFISGLESAATGDKWELRVSFARVMMMGIAALHSRKIVHTDLKPENLLLIPDPSGHHHLKIIDMDWSIFSDRQAPWHGHLGYVGTPGYMSPEHVTGNVPSEASDVYTCALMLSELLGGCHPFQGKRGDEEELNAAIKTGTFKPFRLVRPIDKVNNTVFFEDLVNRALHPEPSCRPSADDLKSGLLGRGEAGKTPTPVARSVPSVARPPVPAAVPRPAVPLPGHTSPQAVELLFAGNPTLRITIDTMVGRNMLRHISDDAQFFSEPQFHIHRSAGLSWLVSPVKGAQNDTLVDGRRLEVPTPLKNGMRLSVGNAAKGIEKLCLTVRLG